MKHEEKSRSLHPNGAIEVVAAKRFKYDAVSWSSVIVDYSAMDG